MGMNAMKNIWGSSETCENLTAYEGIAPWYELWCTGDYAYKETERFYLDTLARQKGRFLELGIGTGRIALKLIEKYPVKITGIDVCRNMMEICEAHYKELKTNGCPGQLQLERKDMTELDYQEEFSTAYLPFRTVGHLLTYSDLQKMFEGVYRALEHSGLFILDHYIFDREWAIAHNEQDILMYQDEKLRIEDYYSYDFHRNLMDCRVKVNGIVREHFIFRWMEKELIEESAVRAGFQCEKLMGDFNGSPWTKEACNQIWIFRK